MISFQYNFRSKVLIKYKMASKDPNYCIIFLILTLVWLASTAGVVPVVQPNTIYGDGGSFSFNLAPYASTTSASLSFALTFSGRVQATSNYLFGYAIQQIGYYITNQKLNYSVTATGAKTATSIMANLYTSNLNKITILNINYIIIQPLFGNYQFYYTWLFPATNLINGQQFNSTITTSFPFNLTGGLTYWTTIVGVDASLASNKEVDLYVSATAVTTTTINFKVSTISPTSFYLTSIIIGAYIFNYNELNNNNRVGRFNTGSFGSVGVTSQLTYTDSSNFVRSTNTILGTNTYHIVNQNYLHIKCTITPNNIISATTNYSFSYMAFNFLEINFVYCNPVSNPYLDVSSKLCYTTCPTRYYANIYQECTACSNYDCQTCDNSGACLTCSSTQDYRQLDSATKRCLPISGYYDNGVSVAVACNPSNCLTCTSSTYCLSCAAGKYLTATNTCAACLSNCIQCTTSSNCQQCATYYSFSGGACIVTCNISNCATCAVVGGSVTCSACSQGYQLSGSTCNPKCGDGLKLSSQGCDDGNTVSGDGCSSTCTIQAGFYCSVSNSRSTCQICMANCNSCTTASDCQSCATGYIFSTSSSQCVLRCTSNCSIVCGNGLHESGEDCDDGNNQNFDGCSSTCTIEQSYVCIDDSSSKSICNIISLNIQKNLLQKQQYDNSVKFCFSISTGYDKRFNSIDWKTVVVQSSSLGFTLNNLEFQQDQQQLCFIGSYTQNINNQQIQISFTFPNSAPFQSVSAIRKQFILSSDNNLAMDIYSDSEYSLAKVLRFTLRFLSFGVLFGLFLGLFRLNLIPLQLAFLFQIAGLSIISLQQLSPTFYCLNQLSYVVFLYKLSLFDESIDVSRYFKAFGFSFNLFNNYNIAASLLIGPLFMGSFLFLVKKCIKSKDQDKLSIVSSMLLGQYSYYGLMICSLNIIVSAFNHSIKWSQLNQLQKLCLAGIGGIICLFIIYFIGQLVHKGYFGNSDQFFRRNSFFSNNYYCLIMLEKVFFGSCISLLSFPHRTSILLVPYVILLIIISAKKPYSQQSGNTRPTLNIILTILILAIVLYQNFMMGVRGYQMYAPFGIAACLLFAFGINTYFYVKSCLKSRDKSKVAPKLDSIIGYSFSKRKLDDFNQPYQKQNEEKLSVSGRQTFDISPTKMIESDKIVIKKKKKQKQKLDQPQKAIKRIQDLNSQLTFENPMIIAFRSNRNKQKKKQIKTQRRNFSNDLLLIKESLAQIRDASQARRKNAVQLQQSKQALGSIQD